ncbi:MAG: hypothetical protein ACOC22_03895 [bacterium]
MKERTLTFKKEKETKNKIRYSEENNGESPPLVETIYLPKWWAKNAETVVVTVQIEEE